MAQWGKRRLAGFVRTILITGIIAVAVMLFYFTGMLDSWLSGITFGVTMLFEQRFYVYIGIMITIFGLIMFIIRSWINWGGA